MRERLPAKARAGSKFVARAKGTAEFDREFVADSFGEPSPAALAQWRGARRKRGRPRRGGGVKVIAVSVERGLLERCDALARKMGVSRASLVSRGLEKVLAAKSAR